MGEHRLETLHVHARTGLRLRTIQVGHEILGCEHLGVFGSVGVGKGAEGDNVGLEEGSLVGTTVGVSEDAPVGVTVGADVGL